MRMTPSIMLIAKPPVQRRNRLPISVARNSGTNLYRKMKNNERENQVQPHHPGGDFAGFAVSSPRPSSAALAEKRSAFMPSDIACPSVPSPRRNGQLESRVLLRHPRERAFFGDDLAIRLAHRDAIAVRGAHHDAFHHGLAADQRFFAAFQDGQHLNMRAKAQETSDRQNFGLRFHYIG